MSENIKELLKRRLQAANTRLEEAKAFKAQALAELAAKCDRAIGHEEGRIAALENLEELDWDLYAKMQLELR
jgi:hypothetical protein